MTNNDLTNYHENKFIFLIVYHIVFIFSSTATFAQNFTYEWAKSFGGIKSESVSNMTTDDQGNLYIAGYSLGEISFESYDLSGPIIFLVKMNNEGNIIWMADFSAQAWPTAIVIDNEYNVYVSGYFNDFFVLNGDTIESHGNLDVFISKYDSNGNLVWIRSAGGEGYDSDAKIAIDSEDNLYFLAHYSSSTIIMHDVIIENDGTPRGVLGKFDGNGNILWIRDFESYIIADMITDPFDNIIISGDFYDMPFGNSILTIHPDANFAACIIIYNKNGEELWGDCLSKENSWIESYFVRSDDDGNIYLIGIYDSELTFDNGVLPGPPLTTPDVPGYNLNYTFIIKYNSEGNIEWVNSIVSDFVKPIQFRNGNSGFYIIGESASSSIHFDSITLEDNENNNFLSKINKNGDFLWAIALDYDVNLTSLVVDFEENFFIAGDFSNSIIFGETTLTSAGESDVFLAKMVESSVGLKKMEAQREFTLYPNPFSTQAVLFSDKELHNATLTITNAFGQVVSKIDNLSRQEITIDRKNLPSGIYFINVFEKDKTLSSKKFIVQ